MRTIVLAMVAAMAATSATAMDLPVPGLALNTEVKAFRMVDAETNHITVEPELRFTPADGPLSLWGEVPLTVYETGHASGDDFAIQNILEDGSKPTLELGADYAINANTTAYAETSWDFDTEDRGEIEVGVSFNF